MAEPQTRENLAQNLSLSPLSRSSFPAASSAADPDPVDRPLSPPAVTVAVDSSDVGIEDPDLIREPKRRKHCPTALENLDELTSASNSSFAFTFDTKFCGFSAEITPKFGSFNSITPEIETNKKKKQCEVSIEEEEEKLESVHEVEEEIGVADEEIEEEGGGGQESVAD